MTGFLLSLSFSFRLAPVDLFFLPFFFFFSFARPAFSALEDGPPRGLGKAYRQGTWLSGATHQNPNQKQVQYVDGCGIEEQAQARIRCLRAWAV
ncbi:hypothetical protein LX32DRAFT_357781 [Colletotrichum zoysiae]|uniref:Uncharacterized protein n=1 Tax=Colletotrichum zoysiae TaxID=1216348 RepID=A0AAD9M1L8_9PEZI|nr:hypothetical protein LX32DRAFT_357781 [Colletotrichum zoysiae]